MRRSRSDDNQRELVKALRKLGAHVDIVSMVGGLGYDLIVNFFDDVRVCEVKDPSKPKSDQALTQSELKAQAIWGTRYVILKTIDDCWSMLDEMTGRER